MQLKLFKTLWGHTGSYENAAILAVQAGFHGLECRAPGDKAESAKLQKILADHKLEFIAEICSCGSYVPDRWATPEEHLKDIENKIGQAKPLAPRFCNVICGCDAWSFAEQLDFFSRALEISAREKITLSFETHRSRSFFNPWVTRDVVARLPELSLTADYSHWTVVCERILDTERETLELLARNIHHIHGRVGYAQGPQVPHPAAPEYAAELAFQQECWEMIWNAQLARGFSTSTMTPEFGPDGYLHTLPFTNMPIAELWELNCWIADTEKKHFEAFIRRN